MKELAVFTVLLCYRTYCFIKLSCLSFYQVIVFTVFINVISFPQWCHKSLIRHDEIRANFFFFFTQKTSLSLYYIYKIMNKTYQLYIVLV